MFELFPEHELFEGFGIDRVLLYYNDIGTLFIASNAKEEMFFVICDNEKLGEENYSAWAILPLTAEEYNFVKEASKEVCKKSIKMFYNFIFENSFGFIYYSYRDFTDPAKNYVKKLAKEDLIDTYNFVKLYKELYKEEIEKENESPDTTT